MVNETTSIQQQWDSRKASFVDLWKQVAVQSDDNYIDSIWDRVTSGYSEAHRHYHSQRHILFCLQQYGKVVDHLDDRVSVGLAIWFHDLILDPARQDNEEQSMRLFQKLTNLNALTAISLSRPIFSSGFDSLRYNGRPNADTLSAAAILASLLSGKRVSALGRPL